MGEDIVSWLRGILNSDRSVELRCKEAADEIEKLRTRAAYAEVLADQHLCKIVRLERELSELVNKKDSKDGFQAIAFVEFRNCSPYIYRVKSNKPINADMVAKYLQDVEGWDEARDNVIILDDELTEITI